MQDRIDFTQEIPVLRKPVMLHEVAGQPDAADRPVAPAGPAGRGGRETPEVGVVVEAPAAAAVEIAGDPATLFRRFTDQPEQWLGTRAEVGGFRMPIVHLKIDVGGVIAAPRRHQQMVPDSLQVGRFGAVPRTCDQQIAAVVVEQGGQ